VIADPATVTGSIGVFALLPRADKALDKLGVHTDGVQTTWLVGAGDARRPLDPRFVGVMQAYVNHTYSQFTVLAAKARKTTPEAIDKVAQGRVWTGAQARERGLIDGLGGFDAALKAAATHAKLKATPRVVYIEPERSRLDRFVSLFGGAAAEAAAEQFEARMPGLRPPEAARQAHDELAWLVRLADGTNPFASLAHCLCSPY